MRQSLSLLAAVVGSVAAAAAQSGSIRGVVTDKDFGQPLASVKVTNVDTRETVQTGPRGNYVFRNVPAGAYTLVFEKDDYVNQVRSGVTVGSGLRELDVQMAGDITDLDVFVVSGILSLDTGSEEALLQLRFESPSLMDSIGIEQMQSAGASTAADGLRLVAGASLKDGKSAVIRGLPDRYVSSQMNGVRLPTADEDKRAVELDQFPSAVIQDIQVVKTFTPDQQGDASGGAVNVRIKGIPEGPWFFRYSGQVGTNSQTTGRSSFLTYEGGGVHYWGNNHGRGIQDNNLGDNWDGAVGVQRGQAPIDYKWSWSAGGSEEVARDVKIGGFASLFYERDSSFFDNGIDDSYWVESPGAGLTPQTNQGTVSDGDFKTALFDVTQGSQSALWGGLGSLGVETENNLFTVAYLFTREAEDTATLAEDTRAKSFFFPGYDPDDPNSPGHANPDAAPYLRLETLEYTERSTSTLQFNGQHTFPPLKVASFGSPELDWTWSQSNAGFDQPDKRQFGSLWRPERVAGPLTLPATHNPYKPGANFTLGNLQRIYKKIDEDSEQYSVNLQLPFRQWSEDEGYLKVGWFRDRVDRQFDQETFSNFSDNSNWEGPWETYWSAAFPFQDHPITASTLDVDYQGNFDIDAYYAMVDLPIYSRLNIIGGVRWEKTEIGVINDPEADATWFPSGAIAETQLNPGDADVEFSQSDALPSIAAIFTPFDSLTLRASYNETTARQTFKELTPILQQEFLGGPIFIGNPELRMSLLKNYDVRADWTPLDGSLLSVSWFKKKIKDPIEYVQRIVAFAFTTAVNYPEGELNGWEFEARQEIGELWEPLDGLSIGGNATLIDSEVTLSDEEAERFELPNIQAPMRKREMTNAPDFLYNLFLTQEIEATGTRLGLFYTVQGDTLIAGAGESDGNFVPSIYATEFDTLNVSVQQQLGEHVNLRFQAKNLTNPAIREVYRSDYTGADVTRTSYTKGIDFSLTIGGVYRF